MSGFISGNCLQADIIFNRHNVDIMLVEYNFCDMVSFSSTKIGSIHAICRKQVT
jgi:hypothetical protein